MGEKTPDTDESGIERRNVLKGLGFGAVGLAGVGAFAGSAAAKVRTAGLTPPDEDLEDNRLTGSPAPSVSGRRTVDLVVYHGMGAEAMLGTSLTILTRASNPDVVTQAFEEGTSECSVGTQGTGPGGSAEIRRTFSVENLPTGKYVAVMTIMNYNNAGLASLGKPEFGPSDSGSHELSKVPAVVVVQEFDK